MKVLVCGSRKWSDRGRIDAVLSKLPDDTELIHGAATGADTFAAEYGYKRGWRVQPFFADWESDGRRAGILRNLAMLDEEPDQVIAFHLANSSGTRHTIQEAQRRGIPVEVIQP